MAKQQWRATYEDVLRDQEKLRKKLDGLVRDGRCIKDDNEREEMLQLYGDALLGEDASEKIPLFIRYKERTINIDDFGSTIRKMCYLESSAVPLSFFENTLLDETIDISLLWKSVRNVCFKLFPRALDKAIKMSKERDMRGLSKGGFTFGKKGTDLPD